VCDPIRLLTIPGARLAPSSSHEQQWMCRRRLAQRPFSPCQSREIAGSRGAFPRDVSRRSEDALRRQTLVSVFLTELNDMLKVGRGVAQAVSRRPLTAEARFRPCGICGGQSGTGTGYYPSSSVFLVNIIPPWLSILMYHLGKNNIPVGGRSSETSSHPIDMKNNAKVLSTPTPRVMKTYT
jgi:hypothetical protein